MSIQDSQKIYNFIISSPESLEQALAHCSPQEQNKIAEILSNRYHCSIENLNSYGLNDLVQNIYWGTLGFTSSREVIDMVERYKNLLRHSVTICNDIIAPHLVGSLKCHQTALGGYLKNNQEFALLAMRITGVKAQKIHEEYKRLNEEFAPFGNTLSKFSTPLSEHISTMMTRSKEITNSETESMKQQRLAFLDPTKKSLCLAFQSLIKVFDYHYNNSKLFIDAQRHCLDLSDPKLADAQQVKAIESGEQPYTEKDVQSLISKVRLLQLERELFEIQASTITGGNFPLIMQTGRELSELSTTPIQPPVEQIKGIQEEFEESYLNWLALVKVNQSIIQSLNSALREVEEAQGVISEVEQDPIAIALRENPLDS